MMENESLKQILRKVQCSHCGYLAFQYDDELEEFMEKLKSVGTEKELNKTGTIGVSPVKQRELNSNDSVSSEISGLKRWTTEKVEDRDRIVYSYDEERQSRWDNGIKEKDLELLEDMIWNDMFEKGHFNKLKYNILDEPFKQFYFEKIGEMQEKYRKLILLILESKTLDAEKVLDDEIKRWYPYTTEFRKGCLRSLKDLKKKLLGEGEKK